MASQAHWYRFQQEPAQTLCRQLRLARVTAAGESVAVGVGAVKAKTRKVRFRLPEMKPHGKRRVVRCHFVRVSESP